MKLLLMKCVTADSDHGIFDRVRFTLAVRPEAPLPTLASLFNLAWIEICPPSIQVARSSTCTVASSDAAGLSPIKILKTLDVVYLCLQLEISLS
jgi:hypothetical protein